MGLSDYHTSAQYWIGVFVVLGLAVTLTLLMTPAGAQTAPPNSYYGTAQSGSGTLAPQGTTIVAVANGEVQDSVVVDSNGQYGSSEPTGEKLRVGSDIDSTVTFHVENASGPQADETDPNPEGEVEELDLTFPAGTFGGPTQTPTSTATATATPTTTATATATTTATTETRTDSAQATESRSDGSTSAAGEGDSQGSQNPDTGPAEPPASSSTITGTTGTRNGILNITNASLNRTRAAPQETVLVRAMIKNPGNRSETEPISLVIDGTIAETRNYSLQPSETGSLQFEYQTNQTGEFTVHVESTRAGTLTVEQSGSLIPWGLLQTGSIFIGLPILFIYGVLKALAIYYGY